MTSKKMASIVPPASRGSKRGWITITGQIPPDDGPRLELLIVKTGKRRTDIIAEALGQYLDREAA